MYILYELDFTRDKIITDKGMILVEKLFRIMCLCGRDYKPDIDDHTQIYAQDYYYVTIKIAPYVRVILDILISYK